MYSCIDDPASRWAYLQAIDREELEAVGPPPVGATPHWMRRAAARTLQLVTALVGWSLWRKTF